MAMFESQLALDYFFFSMANLGNAVINLVTKIMFKWKNIGGRCVFDRVLRFKTINSSQKM